MSSPEEDNELRDMVVDTLEKKGVLGKIKAELRATVFLALEEANFEKCKISLGNQALTTFMNTEKGFTTVSLVRDFLKQFNLDYTLSIFDPEVSSTRKLSCREELEKQLKLNPTSDKHCPLIQLLLNDDSITNGYHEPESELNDVQLEGETNRAPLSDLLFNVKPNKEQPDVELNNEPEISKEVFSQENDSFFDEPVIKVNATEEPLLFSFLGKSSQDSLCKSFDSNVTLRSKTDNFEKTFTLDNFKESATNPTDDNSNLLMSLKGLPSLKDDFESKVLVSETKNFEYEDDFQLSIASTGTRSDKTDNHGDNAQNDDTELSIEEDIEEDITDSARDLLNSSLSQLEEVTTDRTISQLSRGNDTDFMESLK